MVEEEIPLIKQESTRFLVEYFGEFHAELIKRTQQDNPHLTGDELFNMIEKKIKAENFKKCPRKLIW